MWVVQVFGLEAFLGASSGTEGRSIEEVLKAAPFLNVEEHGQILHDGCAILLFGNERDAWTLFKGLPSDDNPPLAGKLRLYATIISPDEGLVSETT